MKELTQGGLLNPGARLTKKKKGTGKRLSPKERAKLKKFREKEVRRKRREARRKGE
jgi:signal recognition particle subunit SRP54